MKKKFLEIYIALLTVMINVNVLYRLVGYIASFLLMNNIYRNQNDSLNKMLDLLYFEERSIIFVFISAFAFIVLSFSALLTYDITSKKDRVIFAFCALIPFVLPQAIPFFPLSPSVWNVIFILGSIALAVYFVYLIYLCVSIIKN